MSFVACGAFCASGSAWARNGSSQKTARNVRYAPAALIGVTSENGQNRTLRSIAGRGPAMAAMDRLAADGSPVKGVKGCLTRQLRRNHGANYLDLTRSAYRESRLVRGPQAACHQGRLSIVRASQRKHKLHAAQSSLRQRVQIGSGEPRRQCHDVQPG